MTSPTQFEAEDLTDEDFFNKLQDDDDDVEGIGHDGDRIVRNFSNLSIGDLGDAGSGGEVGGDGDSMGTVGFGAAESSTVAAEMNSEAVVTGFPLVSSVGYGAGNSEAVSVGFPVEITVGSGAVNSDAVSVGFPVESSFGEGMVNYEAVSVGFPVDSTVGTGIVTTEAVSVGLLVDSTVGEGAVTSEVVSVELAVESRKDDAEAVLVGFPVESNEGAEAVMSEAVPVESAKADDKAVLVGKVKGTGVKVVQWSDFNVKLQQPDLGGFGGFQNSDFLTEDTDIFGSIMESDTDPFNVGTQQVDFGGFGAGTEWNYSMQNSASASALTTGFDIQSSVQTAVADLGTLHSSSEHQATQGTDVSDSQYWEQMYPGWKFDSNTGQWYPIDGYVATEHTVSDGCNDLVSDNVVDAFQENVQGASGAFISGQTSELSYQQTTQSVVETVTRNCTAENVSNLNLVSQSSTEYPPHMVFDPQYPEYYYDMNTQQWLTLDSYYAMVQRTAETVNEHVTASNENVGEPNTEIQYEQHTVEGQSNHDGSQGWSSGNYVQPNTWLQESVSTNAAGVYDVNRIKQQSDASNDFKWKENTGVYNEVVQYEEKTVQGHNNKDGRQGSSMGGYVQPKTWLPEPVNQSAISFSNNPPFDSSHGSTAHLVNSMEQQNGLNSSMPSPYVENIGSTITPESQEQRSSVGFPNNNKEVNYYGSQGQKDLNTSVPSQGHGHGGTSHLTGVPTILSAESQEHNFNSQYTGNIHGSLGHTTNYMDRQRSLNESVPFAGHAYSRTNDAATFRSFNPAEFSNTRHTDNLHSSTGQAADQQKSLSNYNPMYPISQSKSAPSQHGNQISMNYSQRQFQSTTVPYSQFSNTRNEGRSSAGRPPHALVTFGFGGKLIVMKDANSPGAILEYGSQDAARGTVSILSLMDVLIDTVGSSITTTSSCDYFRALCHESFPGPLVGASPASKDVNKWLDEKIKNSEPSIVGVRERQYLQLLLSVLKLSCEHYGKLRSPFGSDPSLEDPNAPESSVAKLFASARKGSDSSRDFSSIMHCMQSLPPEGQVQATAAEVQKLLVSGRRKEALVCAQAGHLWGPAILLASQLGEKFYAETVRQMVHHQLTPGSPLKTLCLLIAGQVADVFPAESAKNNTGYHASSSSQQPPEIPTESLLNGWIENLAIMTANRTHEDHLIITHLGDRLWKERGEINAAHICYLVAEATFESYSDSARFCLIGADHWKCPRTYASPEAIQITELYEYSKMLGNSQFILQPLQPYKLVYAYMLAEVGKVADSLRYCQTSMKLLKNSARSPEAEIWKSLLSSLEERLRMHQQGGFTVNLAPAKLVGKLMSSIDSTINRMMGAPQPPLPALQQSGVNGKENFSVPKVANSQSTVAMSSLVPSPSVETFNEGSVNSTRMSMNGRSVSEPDFGRSPKQDQLKDASSPAVQSKAPVAGGSSRFGRFGSQLLQKTMGWARSGHQAKLGEANKFYYDEKLKRWVEEGAETPAEEPALQPPPTMASFQSGVSNFNKENNFMTQNLTANGESEMRPPLPSGYSSGMPNGSPSPNHFSARASGGIRSRYVDTFNKGGMAPMKSFQSPPTASLKPPLAANFFVPSMPAPSDEHIATPAGESIHEAGGNGETSAPLSSGETSVPLSNRETSVPSQPPTLHRFPSMDNITSSRGGLKTTSQNDGSFSARTRAASWSGGEAHNSMEMKPKPLGNWASAPSYKNFMPVIPSNFQPGTSPLQGNAHNMSDGLHEVAL